MTIRFAATLVVAVFGAAAGAFGQAIPCVDGMAGIYPCSNVTLMSHLSSAELGTAAASDNWGWEDPQTGVEYALVAANEGTIFVSLADPEAPVVVGTLPAHNGLATFIRDVKVYADHAFVTADTSGHGMQVFDLSQLRDVVTPPVIFAETAHYNGISDAHNIAINPETGFAYPVSDDTCSGGLHMIDVSTPTLPVFAGCYSEAGNIHDAVCQVYNGPDVAHQGQEICVAADLTGLVAIVDVTDKLNPVTLSSTPYPGASISHQGWTTEDQRYYIHGDEGDEQNGTNTKTYVFDIQDLDDPSLAGTYTATTFATDHNQYVRGNHVFQGNYRAGFRVLEMGDLSVGELTEVAFLDTRPTSDSNNFSGAWTTFPFFDSGLVIVTDTGEGLFVIRPELDLFADGFESGDTSAWSSTVP
ncbi:MAG: choice-of-anchor B family protein [Acidobacteriota bacterium]|nr:choice-of-anchor B family protein [Acidobacteriota bacterium]